MKPIEDKNLPKNRKLLKKEYFFVAIILIVVIVFFFFSNTGEIKLFSSSKEVNLDYASTLENKLKNILLDVDGVGKVNVLVTVEGSFEEIVLKESDEKFSDGIKTHSEKVVLVGGKPYVLSTKNPKITGVCVVCEGADNLNVKVKITEILTTTLKIDADCVRIIKMK